jgi:hypothetical protein
MQDNDTSKEALAKRLDPQAVLREALMAESQGGGADALNEELRRQAAERAFGGGADEPTDDEMLAIFEQHRKGLGEPQRPQADDEGADEPSDDALWAAYEQAWKGEDS